MKIYTKTGDKGDTGLFGGTRVRKNNPRLEAYGTLDELNAYVGLLLAKTLPTTCREFLTKIQHTLFSIGSYLATDQAKTALKSASVINEQNILDMEKEIDRIDESLAPLTNFILPGGSENNALCHVCRTITRRAERRISDLEAQNMSIDPFVLQYINRLSDYFFVLSRYLSVSEGNKEIYWKQ